MGTAMPWPTIGGRLYRGALSASVVVCLYVCGCSDIEERSFAVEGGPRRAKEIILRVNIPGLFDTIDAALPNLPRETLESLRFAYDERGPVSAADSARTGIVRISFRATGNRHLDARLLGYLETRVARAADELKRPVEPSPEQRFTVKFGVLEKAANNTFRMKEETDSVRFIADTQDYYHGFIVTPAVTEDFEISAKIFLPDVGSAFKGFEFDGFRQDLTPEVQSSGIDYPKTRINREAYVPLEFEQGDPTGAWRIVLFINDRVEADVTYRVYEP